MKYKTYDDVAKTVGAYRWPGFTGMDKRVTKSGIRRFLMAVYPMTSVSGAPQWLQLWNQIEWVRQTARHQLHIVIPPHLWAEDRARLAAKIAKDGGKDFKEERKKALAWTKRK